MDDLPHSKKSNEITMEEFACNSSLSSFATFFCNKLDHTSAFKLTSMLEEETANEFLENKCNPGFEIT